MRLICVTGMHRSGTSLVTRVLNLLGVELGPESAMMEASEANPRGYWEAQVISDLNDEIIESMGGRWHRLPALADGWEQDPAFDPFRVRARAALAELFGDAEVAAFKDPRTSVLLPFWRTVTTVDATVLVVRDPDEVAGSLNKRDGFTPEHGAGLWTDHTVGGYVLDPDRVVVSYEDLLAEPEAGARRLAVALGLPTPSDEVLAEIASFADPALRRNRAFVAGDGPEVAAARDVHRLLTGATATPPATDTPTGGSTRDGGGADAPAPGTAAVPAATASLDGILGIVWEQRNRVRTQADEYRVQGDELRVHQRDLRTALRERDQAREKVTELTAKLREADQTKRELTRRTSELEQARRQAERWQTEYDRLRNRKVVKAALGVVEPLRPIVRKAREWTGGDPTGGRGGALSKAAGRLAKPKPEPHVPATAEEAAALRRRLEETAPGSDRVHGPTVSILVLTRDGLHHLRRMLPGLAQTTYRDFELIVVDNGSSDGSLEYLRATDIGAPVKIIENRENATFSHGNNQALAEAAGAHVLLLNNDIEPAVPGWLGRMVDTLEQHGAAAVGARLIYPRRPELDNAGDTVHPDLTLQHRGLHFDGGLDGIARGRNLGAGEDPLAPVAEGTRDIPGVTAACMLVDGALLRQVGGLTEGYRYGTEDVDLNMKLREAGGTIVYDGGAVLWHHEYGTQNAAGRERKRNNRIHNREQFVDLWGPRVFREVLRDRLLGTEAWSYEPLHVAITITKDDPDAGWGDYYTGHELGDALLDLGFRVSYVERYDERWYDLDDSIDVLVVLIDAFDLTAVQPGITTVAWVRNWTDRWVSQPWFSDFDLVLASSQGSKEYIERVSSKAAHLFPLATNPDRFHPREADPTLASEVLFVGNYWEEPRAIIPAAAQLTDIDLRVHGANWGKVAEMARYDHGHLDYERLPDAYSSTRVVVDDTAGHTKPWGAINSRVFDALAAGALVVSDNVRGVHELFGESFPTWEDGDDLARHLQSFHDDPDGMAALAGALREQVLSEHTYARRAEQLRDILLGWCDATRVTVAIGVPRRELMPQWGDTHFARDVQRQFELAGMPTQVALLPEWTEHHTGRDDVVLHLFGLSELTPRQSQTTVLWNISHPELVTPELVERYDVAFIASERFAGTLSAKVTDTPVLVLPQATEPSRFAPTPGGPRHQLLFVANSRKVRRRIVDDLTRAEGHRLDAELAIYGAEWTDDLVDARHVAGEHVPNAELPAYYAAADIVLNDHWDDMREQGYVSNRIYDALACGSLVVSDHLDEIDELFDGAVVTYRTPAELHAAIERYLSDAEAREELAAKGRAIVLERHTFAARVATIRETLAPILAERPATVAPAR